MAFKFDVEAIREQFPACDLQINGTPIAYLDGPGGTQVPYSVLDAITGYMIYDNANEDGNFRAGLKQGDIEVAARQAAADFLGCDVEEVGYSCSSTQNNYNLAANISKNFKEGDENRNPLTEFNSSNTELLKASHPVLLYRELTYNRKTTPLSEP